MSVARNHRRELPRMTPMERLQRAAFVTFLLHLALSLLALVPASSITAAFRERAGHHPHGLVGWSDGSAGIELLASVYRSYGLQLGIDVAFVLLAAWLAAVPLQMTWLASLSGDGRLRDAMLRGIALLPAALGVTAMLLGPLVVVLLFLVGSVWVADAALGQIDVRRHDIGLMVAAVPGTLGVVAWMAWHDLARAALARNHGVVHACRLSWRAAPRGTIAYMGWRILAVSLIVLGHRVGTWPFPTVALMLTQVLALGRTFVRARWLAGAIDRIHGEETKDRLLAFRREGPPRERGVRLLNRIRGPARASKAGA